MIWNKTEVTSYLINKKESDIFEVKKITKSKLVSRLQQRYYFGVIIKEISNFHWYTPIETHNLLKLTFDLETTTNLSTKEYKDMVEIIRDYWNTNFWVYIPKPNEVEELQSLEAFLF